MATFTNIKSIFTFALANFYRNKGTSLSAVFILTVITLLITGLFFVQSISNFLVFTIQNKIDITAYFKQDTPEEEILNAREEILGISPDIKSVQYVSREDAFEQFSERHRDDDVFARALLEVGDNPFLPSLNIATTGSPLLYEKVSNILQGGNFGDIVEKVDFSQKKDTIEKVFSITSKINRFGLGLSIVLVLVAILVVFNTIKLVINSSRDEISTMNIVGASDWFIKGPFVIEGAIFGAISFFICIFITALLSYFFSPGLSAIMPGFNLFGHFVSNFWLIALIQLISGVGLGTLFSFIAVKKYLEI